MLSVAAAAVVESGATLGNDIVEAEAEIDAEPEEEDATHAGVMCRIFASPTSLEDEENIPSADRLEDQLLVLKNCG